MDAAISILLDNTDNFQKMVRHNQNATNVKA